MALVDVDTKHTLHKKFAEDYEMISDVKEGERRIKEQGTKYLPKLTGQDANAYKAYKGRGVFYGATSRTITGLTGALMRKPPQIENPDVIEENLKDFTADGLTIEEVIQSTAEGLLSFGRHGVLVDYVDKEKRIYVTEYEADEILNWRTEVVGGVKRLTFLALSESDESVDEQNEFATNEVEQVRVLKIDEATGHVVVNLYEREKATTTRSGTKKSDSQAWKQIPVINDVMEHFPKKQGGQNLEEIPFVFFGAVSNTVEPNKPPLLDLVNLNIAHWRTTVDYFHGLHYCALPTPYALGVNLGEGPDGKPRSFKMGPGQAFTDPNENAKVDMLEFTGSGMEAVKGALNDLEAKMAVLGARLLEEQKRAVETAEALTIRASGDAATLMSIALNLDRGFEKVIEYALTWLNKKFDQISVKTNKDFVAQKMSAQQITALLGAVQAGRISQHTFLYQLKQGEILADYMQIEDEEKLIKAEGNEPFSQEPEPPPIEGDDSGNQGGNAE